MTNDSQLWAITPAALAAHAALAERAARGEPIAAAPSGHNVPTTQDSVAHLYMTGVLLPGEVPAYARGRATSMPELADQFRAAAADPSVSAIELHADSPGGTVAGIQQLSDTIYGLRGSKPLRTVVHGQCCSAALWAGSATGKLVLAGDTTQVGSIGVIAHHADVSGAHAAAGIKVTPITSAKFKDAGSPYRPLDEAGRGEIQRSVDHSHSVFVAQLARNLGASQSAVAKVADGRVFHGREAIAAGLAHNVNPSGHTVPTHPQRDVAARARKYIVEQERLGRRVSAVEAVNHITSITE